MIKNANSVFVPASGGIGGFCRAIVLTKSPEKARSTSVVNDEVLSSARLIEDGKVAQYAQEESGAYVKVRVETENHVAEATMKSA